MNYNLSGGLSSRSSDKSVQKKRSQNIQVVVRCRPLNASEKKHGAVSIVDVLPEKKEIHVREKIIPVGPSKSFTFDKVFGSTSKQMDLYRTVVCPILREVLEGYNCTIFAYGQTGTGKTFTMEGERSDDPSISWEDDPLAGIIPRVMNQLFTELQEKGNEYTVYVSYLEIYNEELTDLLNPTPSESQKLNIYEDSNKKGACIISGLTEKIVNNKDEVYQILQSGTARRKTATTLMNAHSSRSHTLFMVTIKTKENSLKEFVKIGKFNLVDLAGSECIGRSGAQDKTAREAGSINQSLLALGRVITTLVEHKTHVPYRESKLTRLLQDSLGGRTKTSIIATISPASSNLEETLSTLDYAYRARNITNKPEINQKLSEETLVKEYAEEIQKLHRDLKAARDKNGIFLPEETYNGMIMEGRDLKERNGMLTHENTEVKEALEECKSNLETTSERLTSTTSDLSKTREELSVTKKELEETRYKKMELQYIGQSDLHVHEMLSDQANQVLLAANDAASDTRGLHVKLDRLRSVESNNNIAKVGFKSDFDLWVNDLRSKVEVKTTEQTKYMSAVHECFESSVEKVRDFTSQKLSLLVEKVMEDVSGLEHAHIRHEHGMNKTIDCMRASVASAVQEDGDRTSNFQKEVVALLTLKMKVAMDCAMQGFNDLKDALTQQRAANISHLERFNSSHLATINQSIAAVAKLNQGQAVAVGKMKKMSEMMWIERAKFEAEIFDQMRAMSSRMIEMQDGIMEAVVEGEEERINHYQHCKSVEEKLVGELNEFMPLVTSQLDTHLETNLTYIDATSSRVEDLNCVQQINENIDLFCSESLEARKNHSELMEDFAEQARNQTEASTKGFAVKTKDIGSLVEEGVDEIRNDQADNSEQLEKVFRSEQEGLVANSNGFGSWNEGLQKNFEEGVVHVDCFLHEKLVDDLPTGSTPKRKHLEYPQDLMKRRKLNDLRAEFKTKFFTNEASDLPLPHGDDDDDEDDELMMMERSSESLDSLASSQQSTSSKMAKNKENIIPPPQTFTVRKEIRRPKVESSNSGKVKGRGK